MSLDAPTLAAILGMAAVTFATRLAGFLLVDRLPKTGRFRVALDAAPGAVLVAVIAPAVLASGPAAALAGFVTALAARRLPLLAVVVVGVAAAALFRALLGR